MNITNINPDQDPSIRLSAKDLRSQRLDLLASYGLSFSDGLQRVCEAFTLHRVSVESARRLFDGLGVSMSPGEGKPNDGHFVVKYSDLGADWALRAVRESRGAVLFCDPATNGWRVQAKAFDKFFNLGESHGPDPKTVNLLDPKLQACVEEKVDGSLILVYRNAYGQVTVNTSGTYGAVGQMNDSGRTFAEGFWSFFKSQHLPIFEGETWVFELCLPENANVVAYSRPRLVLLSYFWMGKEGSKEKSDQLAAYLNQPDTTEVSDLLRIVREGCIIERPAVFPLTGETLDGVREFCRGWKGSDAEGVVVVYTDPVTGKTERVKIKADDYIVRHGAYGGKANFSWDYCVYFAAKGTTDDVAASRPLMASRLWRAVDVLRTTMESMDAHFFKVKDIPVQKDFALRIMGDPATSPYKSFFFSARKLGRMPGELLREAICEDRSVGGQYCAEPTSTEA